MHSTNMTESMLTKLKADYFRANRSWSSFDLKQCLRTCESIATNINKLSSLNETTDKLQLLEINQLRQLVWFLKIKCLSDDYYVSEFLLLNEDDLDDEEHEVRVINPVRSTTATVRATSAITGGGRPTTRALSTTSRGRGTGATTAAASVSNKIDLRRQQTGVVVGRMSSLSSRHSSRSTTTSYRPLTTNVTAIRTAFSRFTRPLLKYSANSFLSKQHFEYLYNTQANTSKCPDYRQCLEYLNLVRNNIQRAARQTNKSKAATATSSANANNFSELVDLATTTNETDDKKSLGAYWLIAFGICYLKLRMNDLAEAYFNAAIETNPRQLDAYIWLVKIHLRSNEPNKVLATCKAGLVQSKSALLYNWMARVQSMNGNLRGALTSLRQSLEYFPIDLEALASAGHFAFYAEKHEQALKCFERIQQMSSVGGTSGQPSTGWSAEAETITGGACSSQVLNNLALCYLYCGQYHKVMPLFNQALLSSSSKETTGDIWYNISFVPLVLGCKNLALACLRLALKSNSEHEQAINNIGVLKYQRKLMSTKIEFEHDSNDNKSSDNTSNNQNLNDLQALEAEFDEAEMHFNSVASTDLHDEITSNNVMPQKLHNLALIKWRRGQLGESARLCKMYLKYDEHNYQIRSILDEIGQLVMFDGYW